MKLSSRQATDAAQVIGQVLAKLLAGRRRQWSVRVCWKGEELVSVEVRRAREVV